MTKPELDRLEELAEKATVVHCDTKEWADFTAAAGPQTALELIEEIERLEKEADWLAAKLVDNDILQDAGKEFFIEGMYCDELNRVANRAGHIELWREAARKAV